MLGNNRVAALSAGEWPVSPQSRGLRSVDRCDHTRFATAHCRGSARRWIGCPQGRALCEAGSRRLYRRARFFLEQKGFSPPHPPGAETWGKVIVALALDKW